MRGGDRWFLRAPLDANSKEVDPRTFTSGVRSTSSGVLTIPVRQWGTPMDFTLADFSMPVVRKYVGDVLEQVAPGDLQRIPARVVSRPEDYEVLNVISVVNCLDEARSEVSRWTQEDGRPEKVGQYRMVTNLHVDPRRVGKAQVFRIDGWKVALIISEFVRDALIGRKITGAVFEEV